MKKTIYLPYGMWGDKGSHIDFASTQVGLDPPSYDLEREFGTDDAFPSEESSAEVIAGADYVYTGYIALKRYGHGVGMSGDTYRIDTTKTKIKKIETGLVLFGESDFSITFARSVPYDSIFGKKLGELIEDGDKIVTGSAFDSIWLTAKSEIVDAREGNDFVDGRAGNDTLIGGWGNDTLVGGVGADRLDGDEGRDTASYAGARKGVTASLSSAATNTNDAKGDYYISIENMIGSSHRDKLTGNGEINGLKGEGGNDWLYGAKGNDDLFGGSGKDVFVFKALSDSTASGDGRDTIFDFDGNGDRIMLAAIDANMKMSGNQVFKFIGTEGFHGKSGELRYSKKPSDTYVYGDVNGDKNADFAIHLDDRLTLDKSDFIL